MIDEQSLIRWLKGADEIFEALEGRGDAYNLCRRWVEEWFSCGKFCITDEDRNFLKEFELLIFNKEVESRIKNDLEQFKKNLENHTEDIAFAFSLYLISWNIKRFEIYFKECTTFSFENFFISLNEVFGEKEFLEDIKQIKNLHLFKNDIQEDLIRSIYRKLHDKLKNAGIKQNEPIATIKIMHIIAPYYIPLLDNPIAKALKREKLCDFFKYSSYFSQDFQKNLEELNIEGLLNEIRRDETRRDEIRRKIEKLLNELENVELNEKENEKEKTLPLLEYMKWLKNKFNGCKSIICQMEVETKKSFLKLLDQAFYIRYSIDIGRRLK